MHVYFLALQILTNARRCPALVLFNAGMFRAASAAFVHQGRSFWEMVAHVLGLREGISLPTVPGYKPGCGPSWYLL